jgi:hypothetical protein
MLEEIKKTLKVKVANARELRREARAASGDDRHLLHLRLRTGRPDRRALHLVACFLCGTSYAACELRTRSLARDVVAGVEAALRDVGAPTDGVGEWVGGLVVQPEPVRVDRVDRVDRMYVVVRSDLPVGLQAAQALHALREFAANYPEIEKQWHETSNTIVILAVPDEAALAALAEDLRGTGHLPPWSFSEFREPDLGNSLTAICVEPDGGRKLRYLPLAFSLQAA